MACCVCVSWKLSFFNHRPEVMRTFISSVRIARLIRVAAMNVLSGIKIVLVIWVD